MQGAVSVTIPNDRDYLSVVRLATSAVAAIHAFDIAEIDDIKTAVAEACYFLSGLEWQTAQLRVDFLPDPEKGYMDIEIYGLGEPARVAGGQNISPFLASCVLETLVDEVRLMACGQGYQIHLRALRCDESDHANESG